jgi:XRE family transcriptional regulator, fatty acid utilization regulator
VSESQATPDELLLLGRAIREARTERDLGVPELAAAAGIEPSDIGDLEEGRLDPTYDLLLAIADSLSVQPSTLVLRAEAMREGGDGHGDA